MAGQEVDVPGSPKRQKMEEPAPPSSSVNPAAAAVSSDENLPAASSRGGGRSGEKEAGAGDQPAAAASINPKPRPYINDGPDHHDPREHDAMIRETTRIANRSLVFYNKKEGTNYVLHRPLLSWCNLFPDGLVIHAIFKAKNDVIAASNNPPSQLFFSETFRGYGMPPQVRLCLILDKSRSDIRRGCAHCPSYVVEASFYQPPVGICEFGDNEAKDYARYQLSDSSGSDTE